MKTPNEKALEFISKVEHLTEGWKKYAVARWMAMSAMEVASESDDSKMHLFYFDVYTEIDKIENDEKNK